MSFPSEESARVHDNMFLTPKYMRYEWLPIKCSFWEAVIKMGLALGAQYMVASLTDALARVGQSTITLLDDES